MKSSIKEDAYFMRICFTNTETMVDVVWISATCNVFLLMPFLCRNLHKRRKKKLNKEIILNGWNVHKCEFEGVDGVLKYANKIERSFRVDEINEGEGRRI